MRISLGSEGRYFALILGLMALSAVGHFLQISVLWLLLAAALLIPWLIRSPRGPTPPLDEVQFTVYRPEAIRPGEWYPMLAFAHRAGRRPDAPSGEPAPIDRVRREAEKALGTEASRYRDTSVDARRPVPREGEITLVPAVEGVRFNPERRSFRWLEDVHREDFRLQSTTAADGTTARGRLSVYLGAVLLAEIDLAIDVNSAARGPGATDDYRAESGRPYRKIFASYAHADAEIVRQYEALAQASGDRYLRDVRDLRAGEDWGARLRDLIAEADVFQLFWSSNAMRSRFVRMEWEHALELGRPNFIRPTYWEDPLPESPDDGLPPEALRRLHFHRVEPAFIDPSLRSRPRRRSSRALRAARAMSVLLVFGLGLTLMLRPRPADPPLGSPIKIGVGLPDLLPDIGSGEGGNLPDFPPEKGDRPPHPPPPLPDLPDSLKRRLKRDVERWEEEQRARPRPEDRKPNDFRGLMGWDPDDLPRLLRRDLEDWDRRREDRDRLSGPQQERLGQWLEDMERWCLDRRRGRERMPTDREKARE